MITELSPAQLRSTYSGIVFILLIYLFMNICQLKDKCHFKTSHRFYKHFTHCTEEKMERYIYIEVTFAIKEDLTSKTWYLMTNEDENDSIFSKL